MWDLHSQAVAETLKKTKTHQRDAEASGTDDDGEKPFTISSHSHC